MALALDQLRVLEAVARLGSFSAAARELNRTTPAVSYTVHGLERALGLTLFDRSGHRAGLTAAGSVLLADARRVLEETHRLEERAEHLRAGYEPELRIIVDGIFPLAPLVRALRLFGKDEVPTRVQLAVDYLAHVPERFERERADLMIALDPEDHPKWVSSPLPAIEMLLLAAKDHPTVAHRRPLTRDELRAFIEIVVVDPDRTPHVALGRLFFHATQVFQVSDFPAKREAILGGLGYGWLPRHLAEPWLSRGRLREVPLDEGPTYEFRPRLVVWRGTPTGRSLSRLLELLRQEVDRVESGSVPPKKAARRSKTAARPARKTETRSKKR